MSVIEANKKIENRVMLGSITSKIYEGLRRLMGIYIPEASNHNQTYSIRRSTVVLKQDIDSNEETMYPSKGIFRAGFISVGEDHESVSRELSDVLREAGMENITIRPLKQEE